MVGMALKDSGLPVTLWEQWSTRDAGRYHKGECAKKWESFHGGGASQMCIRDRYDSEYKRLTEAITQKRADRMALLNGADLPLPGLGVEDGALTYNGKH